MFLLFNSVKRQAFDTCFNQGFSDGQAAGCNSVSAKAKRTPDDSHDMQVLITFSLHILRPNAKYPTSAKRFDCTSAVLGGAFNSGFNAGFNAAFNACI